VSVLEVKLPGMFVVILIEGAAGNEDANSHIQMSLRLDSVFDIGH
jgi:hypothetical protein